MACPAVGTVALVFVQGEQAAGTLVLARVLGVACGVLGGLAVLAGKTQRALAGGASGNAVHAHGAVPAVLAEAGVARVLVLAVLTQVAGCAPADSCGVAEPVAGGIVHTWPCVVHTLQCK